MNKKLTLAIRDVVLIALMAATLTAVKYALNFLPNIELVSLLLVVYTKAFGAKTLFTVPIFVLVECLQWGFSYWAISYLYVWPILIIVSLIFKKQSHPFVWALISGGFGLFFGFFCSFTQLFIGGASMAFAWWISGIPWDLVHCASNFVLCLVLFKPLDVALTELKRRFYQNNENRR